MILGAIKHHPFYTKVPSNGYLDSLDQISCFLYYSTSEVDWLCYFLLQICILCLVLCYVVFSMKREAVVSLLNVVVHAASVLATAVAMVEDQHAVNIGMCFILPLEQ